MLHRLECPDRRAELLASAEVLGGSIETPPDGSGGGTRGKRHHDAARALTVDIPENELGRHLMVVDVQYTNVGTEVGPVPRLCRQRTRRRIQNEPHNATLISSGW